MNKTTLKFKQLIQEKVREVLLKEALLSKNAKLRGIILALEEQSGFYVINDLNTVFNKLGGIASTPGLTELYDDLEALYKPIDKKAAKLINDFIEDLDSEYIKEKHTKLELIKKSANNIQKTLENTKKKKKK